MKNKKILAALLAGIMLTGCANDKSIEEGSLESVLYPDAPKNSLLALNYNDFDDYNEVSSYIKENFDLIGENDDPTSLSYVSAYDENTQTGISVFRFEPSTTNELNARAMFSIKNSNLENENEIYKYIRACWYTNSEGLLAYCDFARGDDGSVYQNGNIQCDDELLMAAYNALESSGSETPSLSLNRDYFNNNDKYYNYYRKLATIMLENETEEGSVFLTALTDGSTYFFYRSNTQNAATMAYAVVECIPAIAQVVESNDDMYKHIYMDWADSDGNPYAYWELSRTVDGRLAQECDVTWYNDSIKAEHDKIMNGDLSVLD